MLYEFARLVGPLRYWIDGFLYRMPKNKKYQIELKQYRKKFVSKPLLIIGNGPSLKKTPLDDFQSVFSIGMNKINLLFPTVRWRPNLILSSNLLVVRQNQDFFGTTDIPVFVSWKNRWFIKQRNRLKLGYYLQLRTWEFSKDISIGVGAGSTITYAAMQFAYYMGANPVILFGVDHSFATKGPANKVVVSREDDASHFDPNYFGKGIAWQLPDLDSSEQAFQRAKDTFSKDNRIIYDATIDGKLEVFPKISVAKAKELCGLS